MINFREFKDRNGGYPSSYILVKCASGDIETELMESGINVLDRIDKSYLEDETELNLDKVLDSTYLAASTSMLFYVTDASCLSANSKWFKRRMDKHDIVIDQSGVIWDFCRLHVQPAEKQRCVLLVPEEDAYAMASGSKSEYEGRYPYIREVYGLYPITAKELFDADATSYAGEGTALVEVWSKSSCDCGLAVNVKDSDIISVNVNKEGTIWEPVRKTSDCTMFSNVTDVSKDELGWKHPMAGISWLRNKQCMTKDAYAEMMNKLVKGMGEMYIKSLEGAMRHQLLQQEIIDEYNL